MSSWILSGALWVQPGWGALLWVCRAHPCLAGQAALAPREVARQAGEPHLGGLHTATSKRPCVGPTDSVLGPSDLKLRQG